MPREKMIQLTEKQWRKIFSGFTLRQRMLLLDDYKWRLEVLS